MYPEYRDDVREIRWTFWKVLWLTWLTVAVLVVLSAVGFGLNALGVFGHTVVERKVFENSYQRSEALKSRIATDEATLAEIDGQLANQNLDDNTRYNLQAQRRAARLRINAARSSQ